MRLAVLVVSGLVLAACAGGGGEEAPIAVTAGAEPIRCVESATPVPIVAVERVEVPESQPRVPEAFAALGLCGVWELLAPTDAELTMSRQSDEAIEAGWLTMQGVWEVLQHYHRVGLVDLGGLIKTAPGAPVALFFETPRLTIGLTVLQPSEGEPTRVSLGLALR